MSYTNTPAPAIDCCHCQRRIGKDAGHFLLDDPPEVCCSRCAPWFHQQQESGRGSAQGTRAGAAAHLGLWGKAFDAWNELAGKVLPEGDYDARFVSVTATASDWHWIFETVPDGQRVLLTTGLAVNQQWTLKQMFDAFAAKPNVDTESLVGRTIRIVSNDWGDMTPMPLDQSSPLHDGPRPLVMCFARDGWERIPDPLPADPQDLDGALASIGFGMWVGGDSVLRAGASLLLRMEEPRCCLVIAGRQRTQLVYCADEVDGLDLLSKWAAGLAVAR